MNNKTLEQESKTEKDVSELKTNIEQESKKISGGILAAIISLSTICFIVMAILVVLDIQNRKVNEEMFAESYWAAVDYPTSSYKTITNEQLVTNYDDYLDLLYEIGDKYEYEQQYHESCYSYGYYEDTLECEDPLSIDNEPDSTLMPRIAPTLVSKFDLDENSFFDHDFVSFIFQNDYCGGGFNRIRSVNLSRNNIDIEVGYDGSCGLCAVDQILIFVPIEKGKASKNATITISTIMENDYNCDWDGYKKPMIYLYPETRTEINAKLGNPKLLTTTYPKYDKETGWKVIASPDGNLELDGKNYYGLYWEGINEKSEQKDEGFIVAGKDVEEFLEEKLGILGLNEREANEFVVYWLPKLEHNEWNYIHFATNEEIEEMMPLEILPKPETIIRILMEYKPLDEKIELKEQKLTKVERKGYTVVEWGGTELGEKKTK